MSEQSINPLVHLQISPRVIEQLQIRSVLYDTNRTMDKYISQLQIRCFNIDSMHQFASLRGRQKRTCSQKILLVWTSQSMICLKFWLSEMRLLRLSNTTNLF